MKLSKIYLLAATTVLSVSFCQAQTADEIIAKYVDAIGGKEKISQVKTLYTETSTQIMGNDAAGSTTIVNGKGAKIEMDFNGSKMIQCFTEKGGWSTNPMGGGGAEAMPEGQYKNGKDVLEIGGPLFNYAAKGNKVESLGKDGNAYKIQVTTKEGGASTYFIDGTTYLVTKHVAKGDMMGQEVDVTTSFSDYKKTDAGLVIPYTINIDLGNFALTTTVKKAEVNKDVDPKIFDMPK